MQGESIEKATPENSAKQGCHGTPVVLGDGATWLLHPGGILNELDGLRDRIDDQARIRGEVAMADIYDAAGELLLANYELTTIEAGQLLLGAEPNSLVEAVSEALFGPPDGGRRTYTSWVASAFLSNGIDPATVPTAMVAQVMHQLVFTRRAVPIADFVESAAQSRKRAGFLALAEAHARAQKDAATPKTETVISGPGA